MSTASRGLTTLLTGTVGTTATVVLQANTLGANNYINVINPAAAGGHNLQVTYDGSTPVIGSVGVYLAPGQTDKNDVHVPTGAVTIIADASSTPYCVEYA